MPYQIDRFNGTPLVTIDDGTVDQSTDLKLVGKNYAGYGEIQNENYVYLLENFSNTNAPPKPLSGQIWFDSSNKKLKFYDNSRWRTTGGAEVSATAPVGLTLGDFWWKTDTKQLYAYNGDSTYTLVGPQGAGSGSTLLESVTVLDTLNNSHSIIKALVDSVCIFIIAYDTFTLNAINPITGFSYLRHGITMVDSATGSTTSSFRFFGTASDSDKVGGVDASNFVLKNAAQFTAIARFNDAGFTVGDDNDLKVFVDGGTSPIIQNQVGSTISFKILDGVTTREPVRLSGITVVPGVTNTFDLGTTSLRWRNVWATTLNGNLTGDVNGTASKATQADTLLYASAYRSATDAGTGNTIVARDASGNFTANVITATATRARYADLAERFAADSVYAPGTVVALGGPAEITAVADELSDEVFGVISGKAAYLMNASAGEDETHPPVAMTGRVPVRVKGKVRKGDRLVSAGQGLARAARRGEATGLNTIGRALEDKLTQSEGVVQAVVKIN